MKKNKKTLNDVNVDNTEINPYEVDKLSKIPSIVKIILLKYWAAAAAVFFMVISNMIISFDEFDDSVNEWKLDFVVILLIAVGIAVLFMIAICPLVKLMNNRRDPAFRYNIFNLGGIWNLLFYLAYSFIVSFIIYILYGLFYSLNIPLFNVFNSVRYGIDPFSYGLFFLIVDGFFVLMKNIILYIYRRVNYNILIKKGDVNLV